MIECKYDLDVTPGSIPLRIYISQYDQKSRAITLRLFSSVGTFTMPDEAVAEIKGTKPDGNGFSYLAEASGNEVVISIEKQMSVVAGLVECELVITKDEAELVTASFFLVVKKAALDKDTVKSNSEIRELLSVIDRTDELIAAGNKAEDLLELTNKKSAEIEKIKSSAEDIAARALSIASNAENDAAASVNDIEALKKVDSSIKAQISEKVDGAFVEAGYLYLTSNNEVVAGPLGPFSGNGGGGGASGNSATLSVQNTTGWLSKTIASDSECSIKLNWSSVEDDMPTGNGTVKVSVNGITKATLEVIQGEIEVPIHEYISAGENVVKVTISDVYGNSRTINFSVSVILLAISSSFDSLVPYEGAFLFTYIPVGSVEKNIYFYMDDVKIGEITTSISNRQQTFAVPAQSHGEHVFRCYFESTINGQVIKSNELWYNILCVEDGETAPVITCTFHEKSVDQYSSIPIGFNVYTPGKLTSDIEIKVNGKTVSTQTVDRSYQNFSYRADEEGKLNISLISGETTKEILVDVAKSQIQIEAEKDALSLYLSGLGRSNNEETRDVWEFGDIKATFKNFNFTSDGWKEDENGQTVLRVSGDARVTIPYKIFAKDFRTLGKTIEIEFSTKDVRDYDSSIISCFSGNRGIEFTAQKVLFKSEQSELSMQYKEDEHIRVAFVVEKKSSNRLIYCYINGIMSGVALYPKDDDFSQNNPVDISIGSNDCTVDIYSIRVYDNDLTRTQIVNNWIADCQDAGEMLDRYTRNSVYDDYGNIVISKLPSDLPYLILEGEELPQYKGDKKTLKGSYTDPKYVSRCFTFENAQVDVQGTSSQYYARKNYKIKFKGGFTKSDGTTSEGFAIRNGQILANTFTFKADVASSEGANNVELVRLYNEACPYKTPYQKENSAIRQGIDGFPIVIFWNNGEETIFLGKYNFNNDKSTPEIFGFMEGDESWEVLNNTSDRVLFKSDDYEGDDFLNDFEARYPEEYENAARLADLAAFLVSCDTQKATSQNLATPETIDGILYTNDTKEYRLAKFKAEFSNYFEKDSAIFYYLFTEIFLMVDSRAKNMFPTIMKDSKWFFLPYDFDTAIGINNEGALAFDYRLEDIDVTEGGADVFNGQQSVLWKNVRECFYNDILKMYQELRSKGLLSYEKIEKMFEEHQDKWSEAIFNEDAWFKYIEPLIYDGNGSYLTMLQGSKAEQRKWWLYNRYRYMDSKYLAGDALVDVITLRGYAKANISLDLYADVYASIKYGSYLVQKRGKRGENITLNCPLDNVNDTEIYIYSASQLSSVGDLAPLMVGYADFSYATKIQNLKLGDESPSYSNGNLTELHLGNNGLLKVLDVRNCPNLSQSVDLSLCSNIEEVYFTGTKITGLSLPNGGNLKKLYLPGSITNLTVRNQKALAEFSIDGYENLSTVRLENNSEAINAIDIVKGIKAGSRVRILGIEETVSSADDISSFYDVLDTMRGLDENGENTDKAQVSGVIHIDSLSGSQMASFLERYPSITIDAAHLSCVVRYYSYDGSSLLYTETVKDGGNGTYTSKPYRSSTAQYSFNFAGWSLEKDDDGSGIGADKNVITDRDIYASYTKSLRTYAVLFYNRSSGTSVNLKTIYVEYGKDAVYDGPTPVSADGSAEDYPFLGWEGNATNITEQRSLYAKFGNPFEDKEILDTWADIVAAEENGTYLTKYKLGNYKMLSDSNNQLYKMRLVAFDQDELADGSGKAHMTWVSETIFASQIYGVSATSTYTDGNGKTVYNEGTGAVGEYDKTYYYKMFNATLPLSKFKDVESLIKPVKKVTKCIDGYQSYSESTSILSIWPLSTREVFGGSAYGAETSGTEYKALFNAFGRIRMDKYNASQPWWLRTAAGISSRRIVSSSGNSESNSTINGRWTPYTIFAFCT